MQFEPGDPVEVIRGEHQGKRGTVDRVEGDRVYVRSENPNYPKPKPFPLLSLRRLDSEGFTPHIESQGMEQKREVHPSQDSDIDLLDREGQTPLNSSDPDPIPYDWASEGDRLEPVRAKPLPNESAIVGRSAESGEVNPSHHERSAPHIRAVIDHLDRLATDLERDALTECWIEQWQVKKSWRYRLCYSVAAQQKSRYIKRSDVSEIQRRITNGKQAKALREAIGVLQSVQWHNGPSS